MALRMASNASWLNHSKCAGEYIEAISVNIRLCSASLGRPIMDDLHSGHLIPKKIKIVSDPSQNLGGSLCAHLLIKLCRGVEDICGCVCINLCV